MSDSIETPSPGEISKLKKNHIDNKLDSYYEIFDKLNEDAKNSKEGLILYYSRLNTLNFCVHVSIISLSATSTFIQSYLSDDQYTETIKLLLLSITSYSGLILAISKFYKLEEKKENAHNLRDRFADLETKINYYIEYIKPWKYAAHYSNELNNKGKDKETEWVGLIEKIESEYINIIDCKRELTASYEKILESNVARIYIKRYINKMKITKLRNDKKHQRKQMDIKWGKKQCNCRKLKLCCISYDGNLDNDFDNNDRIPENIIEDTTNTEIENINEDNL